LNKAPYHAELAQIEVRVRIPDKVSCRQQKINRIYEILKPVNTPQNQRKPRWNNQNVLSNFDEKGGRA